MFDKLIEEHNGLNKKQWTEQELIAWIKSLNEDDKEITIDAISKAKESGMRGRKLLQYTSNIRIMHEKAVKKRDKGMSMVDFLASASEGWLLGGIISGSKKIT